VQVEDALKNMCVGDEDKEEEVIKHSSNSTMGLQAGAM
jgi:hypothetical protein